MLLVPFTMKWQKLEKQVIGFLLLFCKGDMDKDEYWTFALLQKLLVRTSLSISIIKLKEFIYVFYRYVIVQSTSVLLTG